MTELTSIPYRQKRMRYAGKMGLSALIASAILSFLLLSNQPTVRWFAEVFEEVSSTISLSGVCTLLALLITPFVTLAGYRLFSHESDLLSDVEKIVERGRQYWFLRLSMAFVLTFALGLGTMLGFYFIEQLFTNAEMIATAGIIIAILYGGLLGYATAYFIVGLTEQTLVRLAVMVFILGLITSILMTQEREWWRNSISFLGHAPGSNVIFNVMIVCVGLVTLTFVRDLLDDLSVLVYAEKFPRRGYDILRYGLVSMAVLVMGIGLYPTGINPLSNFLHNAVANVLSLIVILGIFLVNWIVPNVYPQSFIQISWGIGAACVIAFIGHYVFGWVNFVAFELILFGLFCVWIYLFLQETKSYIRRQDVKQMQSVIAQNVTP